MIGQINLPIWAFVLSQLIWAVMAGWAIYLSGYLKTKGENLATHEDIEKLKEQVRVITTTTKEIETKISDEAWSRQKRWELKREVLFEASKRLAQVYDALLRLSVTESHQNLNDVHSVATCGEAREKWIQAVAACDMANALVALVCDKETYQVLSRFRMACTDVSAKLVKGADREIYGKSYEEITLRLSEANAAMRKELGIDDAQ